MKSDFLVALTQLAAERNLPREIVLIGYRSSIGVSVPKGRNSRRAEHFGQVRPRFWRRDCQHPEDRCRRKLSTL